MADNVELNAGSGGATLATDDCGAGGHTQIVKLGIATDGSATPIPADANGLLVKTTTALPAGANNIGDVDILTIAAGDNNIGNVDIVSGVITTVSAVTAITNALPTGANVIGQVTANAGTNLNTSALALEAGGNLAAAAASLSVLDDWDNTASDGASVSGDVAHDGVDAGEPVKLGMKAVDLGATPTAVAAADRTNWYATRAGIPFVLGGHPNILSQTLQVTDADGAQTDTAIITVSAGTAIVVTKASVMAQGANTVDVSCRIGFGTANVPAVDAAGIILFHPGIKAGSGVIEGTGAGIIGIGASNEDLRVTCADPVTGSINITITYFTILIG